MKMTRPNIALIGEIEVTEAEGRNLLAHISKPVVAYVAGLTAPRGKTMGHAGAIISAYGETAEEKVEMLSSVGVTIASNPAVIGKTIASVLN